MVELGTQHPALRKQVAHTISRYVDNCLVLASHVIKAGPDGLAQKDGVQDRQRLLDVVVLITSILGFLKASAANASFWTPDERLELLTSFQSILSEDFLISIESALSTIRNARAPNAQQLKHHVKQFTSPGRPLGALLLRQGLAEFVEACAALLVVKPDAVNNEGLLLTLMSDRTDQKDLQHWNMALSQKVAELAEHEIAMFDEGSEYLRLESSGQQFRVHAVKASSLRSFLCCALVHEDAANQENLMSWLQSTLADSTQIVDKTLARTALQCMGILAKSSSSIAAELLRSLPRFLVRGPKTASVATTAADALLVVLRLASPDTVITTLYSLGNSLTASRNAQSNPAYVLSGDQGSDSPEDITANGHLGHRSAVSLAPSNYEMAFRNHSGVILAIVHIARGFGDPKITALCLSMLIQKVGKGDSAIDLKITTEAAALASESGVTEFRALLRLYDRLSHEGIHKRNEPLLAAVSLIERFVCPPRSVLTFKQVTEARESLSLVLKGGSELYDIYLHDLLEAIIGEGDTQLVASDQSVDRQLAAQEIALVLRPLAMLVSANVDTAGIQEVETFPAMQRDAWYNVAIHGFSLTSPSGRKYMHDLTILAKYSQPLIAEERADKLESDVDLNMILRRGIDSESLGHQRREMIQILPRCESDVKSLSYPEVIFLQTAYMVESLRASAGDCSTILMYFADPQLRGTSLGNCVAAVAVAATDRFLEKALQGQKETFSAPFTAQQLSKIFEGCCHRSDRIQQVAYQCADRIIALLPAALCQRISIFALLDLLTLMWTSCLDADVDEYEWKNVYVSLSGSASIHLSDDFDLRRMALRTFQSKAREWVKRALSIAAIDVKGLLQVFEGW